MAIKEAIMKKTYGQEINPLDFENLLLDGLQIKEIEPEDKEYLE